MSASGEFSGLDDVAFLDERRRAREELERVPEAGRDPEVAARYERLAEEFVRRSRNARAGEGEQSVSSVEEEIKSLPPCAARMIAVEILLAEPETLGDDVLESCLYILRERLQAS